MWTAVSASLVTYEFLAAAVLAFVSITALGQLGVQTTSFVAVIGAAGLAVGRALQRALSNFAADVRTTLFQPFTVGDCIQATGTEGIVQETQIFTTVLVYPDTRRRIVSSAQIMGGVMPVGLKP